MGNKFGGKAVSQDWQALLHAVSDHLMEMDADLEDEAAVISFKISSSHTMMLGGRGECVAARAPRL